MKVKLYMPLAAGTLALLAVPSFAQNLLVNGSFESGSYTWDGGGADTLAPGSTAITGWTVVNSDVSPLKSVNSWNITPEDGLVSLDLTGYNGQPPYGGVEQTIATTIGQQYLVQFYIGVQNASSSFREPNSIDLSINAVSAGTFVNSNTGAGVQWTLASHTFTATSTSTTFDFVGAQSGGGNYIGLDNASVQAVPEPSGLVMAAGSILGLVGRRRRRRA